ncbi:trna ligase [Coemansia sp. RSA 720]|nr:trna ligase [Coemansia sp. RSA 720]
MSRSITTKTWGPLTQEEQFRFRQLLTTMRELGSVTPASKRIVRHTKHEFDGREVTSWKCSEFLYKKDPCPLPTQARGLFTSKDDGEDAIVARGYDKFFNVGEVPHTKWKWIEENTRGPYELTVKENGCLILAAGMDDRTLLVTSKHAVHVEHARVGRQWVDRHLSRVGRTSDELAAFLHANNATAVFELCDDSFEEHILEYPERTRGLYLHGINRNSAELDTWPSAQVTQVAHDFGFHPTQCFEFSNCTEAREFADKVRSDHVLDGRAIEGFVVRCQKQSDAVFMFKIKYDEPYLMFREWREITNRIVGDKPYRTTYPMSKAYAMWVKEQRKVDGDAFSEFSKQQGIISARKRFLEHYHQHGGSESVFEQTGDIKVLLMPVASIGCGKTTVALALTRLFDFGHVQNDNITTKKNPRGVFHRNILREFDSHDFVIADRNNHLPLLRQTLTTAVREELVNCRVVALYWDHSRADDKDILRHTVDRVVQRGEEHQSLTPKRTPDFRKVMNGFVRMFAPLDRDAESDRLVDDVIELDPLADSTQNLRTVIDALCGMYPDALKRPSDEEITRAVEYAMTVKPTVQKNVGSSRDGKPKREPKPVFFGLVPRINIGQWLEQTMASGASWDVCRQMLQNGSHDRAYHITVAHVAATKGTRAKAIYEGCVDLFKHSTDIVVDCVADYVVCNGSVMALRVKTLDAAGYTQLPRVLIKNGSKLATANAIPHITLSVGEGAKAVHANDMLQQVFGPNNGDPVCPEGWAVVPVHLEFTAEFEKFMR